MEKTGNRIRQIRESLHLTQEAFAEPLGVSRGAVANWERDKGIKTENLTAIAATYGVALDWLIGKDEPKTMPAVSSVPRHRPEPNASDPEEMRFSRRRIPVFGSAVGGIDGRFVLNGQKVAEVLSLPALDRVPDAYAVYVHGDSMEPRYESGEIVYVDPHRPVRRGNYVVAQIIPEGDEDGTPFGYVKKFISQSPRELVLEQLNPPPGADKIMRFPGHLVRSVHKIVGAGEG